MVKFYPKCLALLCLLCLPLLSSAKNTGGPLDPIRLDSMAMMGHCSTMVIIDTNCVTHQLTISAFVYWTWTGVQQPLVALWNNGLTAHKITVSPPGTWSWETAGTSCEPWHAFNSITLDYPFYEDSIEIIGPKAICPTESSIDLTLNINGYSDFETLEWTPANPTGEIEPYTVTQSGTYSISVVDAFGCATTDQITVVKVPLFVPAVTGPSSMCPEGDTAAIAIVNPALYSGFEWTNGETTSPIEVNDPGTYNVIATDVHGCTGEGSISIQSAGVDPFGISVSHPALCPGLMDTLRVVGAYSDYEWSNQMSGITNIVNQAGTYTVTVTNAFGCTGTSSATITPLFPPVIQIGNTPLCLGDTAVLSTLGGTFPQYSWSTGQTTQSINALQPGTYIVTVSGGGICTTSTATLLDFAPAPITTIAPPGFLNCLVDQTVLNGSGSSSGPNYPLNWTTQDGHFVSGDSTLNPTIDFPGLYVLSITNDSTGCITRDTVVVTQDLAPPPASAGNPADLTCVLQSFNIGPIPVPADSTLIPSWSTPDGNILSGNDTWAPNVDQPGNYLVTVTNALNGCTSTSSVLVGQDIAPPNAQIAPANLITCTQGTVPLDGSLSSAGPEFAYQWTTANGLISGPTNDAVAGASSIGTYNLLVTNTLNGCTSIASVTVSADVNIPIVAAVPTSILNCTVLNTTIDATASSSGPGFQYNWTTLNGNILNGGNTLTPTVDAPGTYTLNLLNSANNCNATLAVIVNQDITPPLVNAGPDAILNCTAPTTVLDGTASSSGANFSYNWTTVDGNILSGNGTLSPTVNMDGTYVLQVTNQLNGCTATASVMIMNDANAPTALIAAPATLTCTTQQTMLDASTSTQTGNLSYVWSGNILSGQGTLQPTTDQPGIYTLSITNLDNGCTDVATVTILQDIAAPAVQAGANSLINCFSPTGLIGSAGNPSGPGFILQWTTTGGNFISPTNGPTALINQPGDYQLLITNLQNGCTATDQVSISSDFAAPAANAGPTNELTCVLSSVALQGSGSTGANFNYLWTSSPGGNITSGANTLAPVINEPGDYTLLVTNTQNGCTATSQVSITENANGPTASAGSPQTLTCTFTNTVLSASGSSTGPLFSYSWSTQNGNITAGANTFTPAINAPGLYTVTVTNSSNLCTETASVTILQNIQSPVVDAGSNNQLTCAVTSLGVQAVILSSASQNIGYQWSTVDGQILNGGNTASPNLGAPGTYIVTVTDALNGCVGTDQLLVTEDVTPPLVQLGSPETLTCAVSQIILDALGCTIGADFQYNWTSSAGGNFVSTQNPQEPVVDEKGVYTLVITNLLNGCSESASVTVLENVALPIVEAGATVGLDCDTQTQTLSGTGSSLGPEFSYTWSTTNGQILSGVNSLSPTIGDPGNYVLTILNTQNGCTDIDNVLVTEDVLTPTLAISPPQLLTCTVTTTTLNGSGTDLGSSNNISWTTSNGNILSGSNSLNPSVDAPGIYTLTVQNTGNGCSASVPVTVLENILVPPVQIQPSQLLTCEVAQITLQGITSPQASLVWTSSNGQIVSGVNTANPTVSSPGLYQLNITSPVNGCTNSAQITVQQEMNVPTGLQFKLQPPLCNGTPGALNVEQINGGVGPFAYSMDGGQTFFAAQAFNGLAPGNYDLVIQDANGCELMQPVTVPPPPIPLVTAPPEFKIELGENQEILAIVPPSFPIALVDTVIWNPTTGLSFEGTSTLQLLNPVAQPYTTTQYTVTILSKEGCKSVARTIVKVDKEADIYVPNIIWPDDPDGDNAIFMVFARDASIAIIKKLQVFDRWGSLVFSNQDFRPNEPAAGWSGDFRGEMVNPGVFVWWVEVELVDGRRVEIKGDVTVVR
jgi:hypothetical protein